MGLLRLLLAISVVLHHSGPIFGYYILGSFSGGSLPVNSFFIISGFYMAFILSEKYIQENGSYLLFITNRFLRIYPIYLTVLLVTIITGYIFVMIDWQHSFTEMNQENFLLYARPLNILGDFTLLIRSDLFTIDTSKIQPLLISPAWTLILELQFYLLAPFIVKKKWWIIFILLCLSVFIRYEVLQWQIAHGQDQPSRFFPAKVAYFLLGVLSYKISIFFKKFQFPKFMYFSTFLVVILVTFFWENIPSFLSFNRATLKESIYYLLLVFSLPLLFNYTKKNSFDMLLGSFSYPVYISHMFFYYILLNILPFAHDSSEFAISLVTCSILGSLVLIRYIDKPVEKFRQSRVHNSIVQNTKSDEKVE